MILSCKRTADILLLVLAGLAVTAGVLEAYRSTQQAILTRAQASLASLHLKSKDLQLLQRQVSATAEPAPIDAAVTAFRTLQALSQDFQRQAPERDTAKLLESYRAEYLALFSATNKIAKHQQVILELLALIEQRLALLPGNIAQSLRPALESFHVQAVRLSQGGDGDRLTALQSQAKALAKQSSDPTLLTSIAAIAEECRQRLADQTTIPPLEQSVGRKAHAFIENAETGIGAITSAAGRKLRWCRITLYSLLGAMIGTLALAFKVIRSRLAGFIAEAEQAEQAIRSARYELVPAPGPGGELAARLQFLHEIAGRLSQYRADHHQASQRLRILLDATEEWVLVCNAEQVCTFSNAKAQAITGAEPSELNGKSLPAILEGNPTTALAPSLADALAARTPFAPLAYEAQHINGTLTPVEVCGHPLVSIDNHFDGFLLAIRNLSAVKESERHLEQSAQTAHFLHKVLELALLDIELPELMDRFLGCLIDRSWSGTQPRAAFFLIDRTTNSLTLAAQRGLDQQVRTSCSVLPIGTCLCGRTALSGKIIFADCHDPRHELHYPGMAVHGHYCLPVHSVAGEIIGVVVLYLNPGYQRDSAVEAILANATTMAGSIIRRRQVEDELKAVNQDLERRIDLRTAQLTAANEELAAFAYSVSHDLRAPLRAITGFSNALEEDCRHLLSPEGGDYLARIKAGCLRMESLIDDILDLSRLNRQELRREQIDLSQIAREISEEIRAESPHRMVEWKIAPDLEAKADPTMVRAVLTNLLANAWKYSQHKDNARIELGRLRQDGGESVCYIRDNGAGFDMRYATKLFKPFQRLHPQEQFSGNGIGLATVQRIINRHGGRIWADATVGEGATFYFTLAPPAGDQS